MWVARTGVTLGVLLGEEGACPVLLRGPGEHVHGFFFSCNKQQVVLLFREGEPHTRSHISDLVVVVVAPGQEEQLLVSTVTLKRGIEVVSPLFCITERIFEQRVRFSIPWTGHEEDLPYLK